MTTAVTFDPGNTKPVVVFVGSNRAFHALVSRAATASNSMLTMDGGAFIRINGGETLSVIATTGETAGIATFTLQGEV